MKKIISLLVAVLLIASALPLSIGAAAAPTAKIGGHNLIVSDNVYLAYMVNVTGTPDETGLLVWDAPQSEYTYANKQFEAEETEGTVGNTHVFKFTQIVAKQMTDDFYAVGYAKKNGTYYYSEPDKYSIAQYVYNKMGKTGTGGTNDKQLLSLLDGMLAYGAAAQKYFSYKTNKLATDDLYQIKTVDAKLSDNMKIGLYKSGESVKITASTSRVFVDELGNMLGEGTSVNVTASKNMTVSAVDAAPASPKKAVEITKLASASSVKTGGDVTVVFSLTNNTSSMQTVTITETLSGGTMKVSDGFAKAAPFTKTVRIPAGETVTTSYAATVTGTFKSQTAVSGGFTAPADITVTSASGTLKTKNVFLFGDATIATVLPLLCGMAQNGGYSLNIKSTASNSPASVKSSYNIQELFEYDGSFNVTGYSDYGATLKTVLEGNEKYDLVIPTGANWTLADTANRQPKAISAIKFIQQTLKERGKGETLYLLVSPAYEKGYDFAAKGEDGAVIFGGLLADISGHADHYNAIIDHAKQQKNAVKTATNVKFIKAGISFEEAAKNGALLYNNAAVGTFSYTDADGNTATSATVVNKHRFHSIEGQYLIAANIYKALAGDPATLPAMGISNAAVLKEAAANQTVDFNVESGDGPIEPEDTDDIVEEW